MDIPSEFSQGSTFNMSLESLSRINDLLKDCSNYSVNGNWLGLKNNLLEIYKELVRCSEVDKGKLEEVKKRWGVIDGLKCFFDKRGLLIYDPKIPVLLTEFDFFISRLLYEKGLTMAKNDEAGKSLK